MKTLFVLRHAKSSWDQPDIADFDRPLNGRGRSAAPLMGRVMRERGIIPEVILSSPAQRARDTALLVKESGEFAADILYDPRIYEAGPQTLAQVVSEMDEVDRLMLVGHNPGIESLVRYLTGRDESMPTAALAVIELDIPRWENIGKNSGRLAEVIRPKEVQN
jgi:phosphohistidine phosphatase